MLTYLQMCKTWHESLVEGQFLRLDGHIEVPGDGEELADNVVLLIQLGQLGGSLGEEGEMLHKLLHGLRRVVQLLRCTLIEEKRISNKP